MAKKMVQREIKRGRRYKLQPRDFAILRAIYDHTFLTRGIMADLFPPKRTKKRNPPPPGGEEGKGQKAPQGKPQPKGGHLYTPLRRLYDHEFIERLIPSTTLPEHEDLVYSITADGVKALRSHYDGIEFPSKGRIPYFAIDRADRKRVTFNVIHELMIARFHVRLLTALKDSDWKCIQWDQQDTQRKWRAGGKDFVLDPDAVCVIENTKGKDKPTYAFFLECDRGTMTQERMANKYHRYVSARVNRIHSKQVVTNKKGGKVSGGYNLPNFRVLTVTERAKRAVHLAGVVAKTGKVPKKHKDTFYFLGEDAYEQHPRNLLSMIWKSGDGSSKVFAIISNPPPLQPKQQA